MPLPASVPELAALDLLRSVVKHGSLSRAADAHGITQPSASSRIRTLERQLGITVLERSPTGSRLTPDGQLVARWADTVLESAQALASGVESLRAHQSGLLRVAASYTIAEYFLPPWLDLFLAKRPTDSVTLDVTNSRAVLERVELGAVDIGFIESPLVPPTMSHQVIATDELVLAVSSRHPWAATQSVDLNEFLATPLVLREPGSGTRDSLVSRLAELGHNLPRVALDLGSISAVRIAVISGSSPTVISRLAIADDLKDGRLVEVSLPEIRIERRLHAIWPHRGELPRLAAALLQSLPSLAD
jgi:DNA-binding transcriptional LysR family regulator